MPPSDDDRIVDDRDQEDGPSKKRPSNAARREEAELLHKAGQVQRAMRQRKRIDDSNKMTSHPECLPKAKDKRKGIF